MRQENAESDVIVLHEYPKIGSYELITIAARAKRGYTNPAVVRYKSSFITVESGTAWIRPNYPQKYARAVIEIPGHSKFAVDIRKPDEPWNIRETINDFNIRDVLRRSIDFVDKVTR
jgi:hypothetical protein